MPRELPVEPLHVLIYGRELNDVAGHVCLTRWVRHFQYLPKRGVGPQRVRAVNQPRLPRRAPLILHYHSLLD